MDRLMERGHGPAVYSYGYGWFRRCLEVAKADEKMRCKMRRNERAACFVDMRIAAHAKTDDAQSHLRELTGKAPDGVKYLGYQDQGGD
ncbi:hypothetical protein G3N56_07830 [Desulfovibrio sulfodismutans]|uniref:Uncharacterized protein n=1 Tax=Desulfolutivibrio sulfodismutans TaxID=63561 RepID=A0A7K3NKC1_9BACT|nr:hypothetical protein [Desulfolutivibrio sulfodismutans]NDY56651.1 hypothetical protein [Desulfolutivibrio sulfodismutans]QLA11249.1 hypothetical protein GD606_02630 [Desulfolutivibrio sulfodismutans DSM 3696]